ncbi:MAG: translation initiation factor IF-2 [Gammaproteobacteria bacterium]|nr:translation initiation factor IF-2 [Gammaproteobacteria bacterium]
MLEQSIQDFAERIGLPLDRLRRELAMAGVDFAPEEGRTLTAEEKAQLLLHLRHRRGNEDTEVEPSRITLRRRQFSELKVPAGGAQGRLRARLRAVSVEFRKSRTYAKRGSLHKGQEEEALAPESGLPASPIPEQPVVSPPPASPPAPPEEAPAAAATRAVAEEMPAAAPEAATEAAPEVAPVSEVPPEATPPAGAAAGTAPPPAPAAPAATTRKVAASAPGKGKSKDKAKELHISVEKAGRRRKKPWLKTVAPQAEQQHTFQRPSVPVVREVEIPDSIAVSDLALRMAVKVPEVIKMLMNLGTMVTINQSIDQATAAVVVEEMGHKPKLVKENSLEEEILQVQPQAGEPCPRAPVVTVMGHVDHGKTSLLDRIRSAATAASEKGGITQHIGAYSVRLEDGGRITFLDTPGHEAFTAMRARGTQITDIAVLVVAADDGVMPQTREAIQHARAASVPLVVAVNKIDRKDADPERVRQELAKEQVISEEWGGDTICVNVSASTGEGVDKLLRALDLQAELLELRAVEKGPASGTIIESYMDRTRGPVATLLVQEGELRKGDYLLSGSEHGRVRSLLDERSREIESAGPATPATVLGFSGLPGVGERMIAAPDERKARELAARRKSQSRERGLEARSRNRTEDMFSRIEGGSPDELRIVLKADMQGTAEVLVDALEKCSTEEAKVAVVGSGVGGITESDVNLARTCGGLLFGFNIRADSAARKMIREEGLELRYYSVIYEMLEDVQKILAGMKEPETRDNVLGVAEVREVFRSSGFGQAAGCLVLSGVVRRGSSIRVLRDDVVLFEASLESLRRFKEDVAEVKSGVECGIGLKAYKDIRVGDRIESFERVVQERAAS